jgi:uncharacterized membrane protein YphA (DoxX/SURF4 family)
MKAKKIGYWAATGLVAFAFLSGGAMDLAHGPEMVAGMAKLGYPAYFMTILGAWKVLGAIAVLLPRTARLKEWAYAGMVFDLTGAAFSHAASGDPAGKIITPLVLTGLVIASWALRPETRVLKASDAQPASAPRPEGRTVAAVA